MMRIAWITALLLGWDSQCSADDWAGTWVMLKSEPRPLCAVHRGTIADLRLSLLADCVLKVSRDSGSHLAVEHACILANKGDVLPIAEAITFLDRRIGANSNSDLYFARRAAAYRQLGRIAKDKPGVTTLPGEFTAALADITKAIELNPNRAAWWILLGELRWDRKEFKHALDDYTEAIRLQPDWYCGYYMRGQMLVDTHVNEAIRDYDEAIKRRPHEAMLYQSRGFARCIRKDYSQGVADVSRAIELDPQYVEALSLRSFIYMFHLRELDKSIADLTTAIAIEPSNAKLFHARGMARLARNEREPALQDVQKAIELKPDDATHYNSRGMIRRLEGDFGGALEDWRMALKLDPKQAHTLKNLSSTASACCREEHRNGEEAMKYAKMLLALSNDWEAHELIAMAHAELGDFTAAIAEETIAINMQTAAKLSRVEIAKSEEILALFKSKKAYRTKPMSADPKP